MRPYNCNGIAYQVKAGDTLYGILRRYNVPLAAVLRVNPTLDVYNLQPGMVVCLPVLLQDGVQIGPVFPVQPDAGRGVRRWGYNQISEEEIQLQDATVDDLQNQIEYEKQPAIDEYNRANNAYENYSRMRYDNRQMNQEEPEYVIISYVVKNDDSLQNLFDRFGIGYDDLRKLNDLNDIMLRPGMLVKVPNKIAMDDEKYEN